MPGNEFHILLRVLAWKSYTQRLGRWRLLATEAAFAVFLCVAAVISAYPVFMTPLQAEPRPPKSANEILKSLNRSTIVGYAPAAKPYDTIMDKVAKLLDIKMLSAPNVMDLNMMLYNKTHGHKVVNKVIWVIWQSTDQTYTVRLRSTEVAHYATHGESRHAHLKAGFLAMQIAISQAVIELNSPMKPVYDLSLAEMPVSPLMEKENVRRTISIILMSFTLALLPPVTETEYLIVTETTSRFKRSLRMRGVPYSVIYLHWLTYAFLTALPICLIGAITLILIFRWIHLLYALLTLLVYTCLMMMQAFIMAMFHSTPATSITWTALFAFMQTFLAELMVHHDYDSVNGFLMFLLQMIIPPFGLLNGLNKFALLQTGSGEMVFNSLVYTIFSWCVLIIIDFQLLMLLQWTIGQERAIGGQVSWKSIIFKKEEDVNELRSIENPTGRERDQLQEVDELMAKAVSFRHVTKTIMDNVVLKNLYFDIYRGEYTTLFTERVQDKMMHAIEDLLCGLTYADSGTIHVLGTELTPSKNLMCQSYMMGYLDEATFLIEDLTVNEHLIMFLDICLYDETGQFSTEYSHLRLKRLLKLCDLEKVANSPVWLLHIYYRAQLCWALAILMEPRIVIIPVLADNPLFSSVIKDKVVAYKKYLTIIQISFTSGYLEFCDRAFLFDKTILAFGGTPAYMFFKYGREYRVRLNLRQKNQMTSTDDSAEVILEKATEAGASIRSHLGSLLILRIPTSPTEKVAALITHLSDNAQNYGISAMNVSVPDTDEVFLRAIYESREKTDSLKTPQSQSIASKTALKRISANSTLYKGSKSWNCTNQFSILGWKYISFYMHFRFLLILSVLAVLVAGVFLGLSLVKLLRNLDLDHNKIKILQGEELTVEDLNKPTTLVLRLDNSKTSQSLAHGYVISLPNANKEAVDKMNYIALEGKESLTEYLATCAIDAPQIYVYKYAYGIDIRTDVNDTLHIHALFSPLHPDQSAAARSLGRVYMALLRHYTGSLRSSIVFIDDPLTLDLLPWMKDALTPPLWVQFVLVFSIAHITLLPSLERGLIRHTQAHAYNFSPIGYWLNLYIFDLILYWFLVGIMSAVMVSIMVFAIPNSYFEFKDVLAIPFMLCIYGVGSVPLAYLFSLGQRPALNSMALIITSVLAGEPTIIAKWFYGELYTCALGLISLSPQYNMADALVIIRELFVYNSECKIFMEKNYCNNRRLHKCCSNCGVLQECFRRKSYLENIQAEVTGTIIGAVIFTALLMMWEYKIIHRVWNLVKFKLIYSPRADYNPFELGSIGIKRERTDVRAKERQLLQKKKHKEKVDTFGEYLLAVDVSIKQSGVYAIQNVYLGLGKSEALALSGLKRHGRTLLCKMLAGIELPSEGRMWGMSKFRLGYSPHNYAQYVSICCDEDSLPQWMTVYDGLKMIGLLRGVGKKNIDSEVMDFIQALDLKPYADILICRLNAIEKKRVNFAAAVIGAPPIIVLDECMAHQRLYIRRAMFNIIDGLKKQGHGIFISSSNVESHMPVTNRLAVIVDGRIVDLDYVRNLLERHSDKGFTVVVHLKDEVDIDKMFREYFREFSINDTTDVLVNVQILDALDWASMFAKMELLKKQNHQVYSYVICAAPVDYIYNKMLEMEGGHSATRHFLRPFIKKILRPQAIIEPPEGTMEPLQKIKRCYDISRLTKLPWSVMFHR